MKEWTKNVKRLIEIPSVLATGSPGKPFGDDVHRALVEVLAIASAFGMEVFLDPRGYYGYAQVGGYSEDLFGVLCHMDVVGPGKLEDWNRPPFEFHEDEEFYYGRGIQDDKGPTLLAMHALMDLLNQGAELRLPVRFIFGTDEETLWRGIERYKEDQRQIPSMGFTPDSDFPLTYAEKGLWQVDLVHDGGGELDYRGGQSYNVVPGEALYQHPPLSLLQQLENFDIEYHEEGRGVRLLGRNAHAAKAHEGKNALTYLLTALHQCNIKSEAARFTAERLYEGIDGSKIFSVFEDEISGGMTVNLGKVDLNQEKERISLDIRYPVSLRIQDLQHELAVVAARYGLRMEVHDHQEPLFIEKDSFLIEQLMEAYREISGDEITEPGISGGATYARSMENFVAFGALLPGEEGTEHQPNERMSKFNAKQAYEIYQRAFEKLVIQS